MTWRLANALAALVFGVGVFTATPSWAQKDFSTPPQVDHMPPGRASTERNTRFTLTNASDQIIDNLNISPPDDDSWGDDLFGTLALPPNSRVLAGTTQNTGCIFDVRVVYHDHREEVLRRQDLCQTRELIFSGKNARRPSDRVRSGN